MLQTKLCMPNIGNNIISRQNIEKKLMLLPEYKIALITAPAGYGKTTAVANYLVNHPIKYAWFSLDASENDPVKFWRYLIASAALSTKNFSLSNIWINEELLISNITANMFIDMLKDISENIILAIDNCHFMNCEMIVQSMSYFIRNLPQNVNVIFIGRTEPSMLLSYAHKKAIIKIGIKELSFGLKETEELLIKKDFFFEENETKCLMQATDGWALGLSVSSFQQKQGWSNLSNDYLDDFFQNEVLYTLSEDIRKFLVQTSFLDKLSGPLCASVTGHEKSEEILKMLFRNNSFILPEEQRNKSYRVQNMFRSFLLGRLQKEAPELRRSLYCKAGEWYVENGFIVDAMNCYVKAEEFDMALKLVCNKRSTMELQEYSSYQKLIESLPVELCEKNLLLCSDYSWILTMENNLEAAECWAEKAQNCLDSCKETMTKSESAYMQNTVVATYLNLAIVNMDVDMAEQLYKKISGFNLYSPILTAELNVGEVCLLKTVYGYKGHLNKIDETYSRAIETIPEVFKDMSSYFAVILAECQYERNDLQAVYTTLSKFMGRITRLKYPGLIVPCIILLAKEKLAKGCFSEAFDLVESGRRMLTLKKNSMWSRYFDSFTASLFIHKGDAVNASKYLDIEDKCVFDTLSVSGEFEYIIFARYLMLINNLDESLLLLSRLEEFALIENRRLSLIEILCLKAINHYLRGEQSEAMSVLDAALGLGIADGYVRTFVNEGLPMAELLTKYRTWERFKGEQKHAKYVRMLSDQMNNGSRTVAAPDLTEISVADCVVGPSLMSARELEVLQLLMAEYSNAEIADELFITERTVKHHNARIYEKLGVKNRLEAILKAREIRLIG